MSSPPIPDCTQNVLPFHVARTEAFVANQTLSWDLPFENTSKTHPPLLILVEANGPGFSKSGAAMLDPKSPEAVNSYNIANRPFKEKSSKNAFSAQNPISTPDFHFLAAILI
jgi:hypothetical protein